MKYSVNIVYLVYMLYLLMFWSLYSDKNVFTDQKLRHASHSTFSAAPESFSTPLSWGSTLSFSWLAENVATGNAWKSDSLRDEPSWLELAEWTGSALSESLCHLLMMHWPLRLRVFWKLEPLIWFSLLPENSRFSDFIEASRVKKKMVTI